MRYVRIENGIVTNIIDLDHPPTFAEPEGSLWRPVEDDLAVQYGWVVGEAGEIGPPPPPAVSPPSKSELIGYAADRRWRAEQAGTEWNGWPIHTDDRSQGKYLSELQAIALDVRVEGDPWKFADGVFRPVSNAEFPQLAIAAREHVRTVFGIEALVLGEIEADTITTTAQIEAAFA